MAASKLATGAYQGATGGKGRLGPAWWDAAMCAVIAGLLPVAHNAMTTAGKIEALRGTRASRGAS